MTQTTFFRLLKTPIDDKGETLAAQIAALNETGEAEETFTLDPADFQTLPGTPFVYSAPQVVFRVFQDFPSLEETGQTAVVGLQTSDNFRFTRAWWEIPSGHIGFTPQDTREGYGWVHFAKGGAFSPFYADVHLVVNWWNTGQELHKFERSYIRNEVFYFRPGLTWPRRPHLRLSFRALPTGCIFDVNGPSLFCQRSRLLPISALTNSTFFQLLASLSMGRGSEGGQTQTFEAGAIQIAPIPRLSTEGFVESN